MSRRSGPDREIDLKLERDLEPEARRLGAAVVEALTPDLLPGLTIDDIKANYPEGGPRFKTMIFRVRSSYYKRTGAWESPWGMWCSATRDHPPRVDVRFPVPHHLREPAAATVKVATPPKPKKPKRVGPPPAEKPPVEPVRRNRNGQRVAPSTAVERWVLHRDSYRCQRCGVHRPDGSGLHLHHVVEIWEGGQHDPDHLETLCEPCHMMWTWCATEVVTYEEWKRTPPGHIIEMIIAQCMRDTPEGRAEREKFWSRSFGEIVEMMLLFLQRRFDTP